MALGKGKIKLGDKEYETKVKLKDVLRFIKGINRAKEAAEEGVDPDRKIAAEEAMIDTQAEVAVKILEQGDNGLTEDQIDALVAMNISDLNKALPVSLGMATEKQLEEAEQKANEQKN